MWKRRAAIGAVIAAAGILVAAAPASAYNLTTLNFPTGASCSPAKFSSSSVKVVLHLKEAGVSSADQTAMTDAVTFINSEIGTVGGSTAYVSSTTTTNNAFVPRNWFGDTTPTIHVGFTSSLTEANATGETFPGPTVVSSCTYNEVHIGLLTNTAVAALGLGAKGWDYGTPGADYYEATETGTSSNLWFRAVYLHELLHAFGLAHTSTEYAMMNYGIKPWANRPDNDRMRPLPDDAAALRTLYPGTTTRHEIAVFNTWYDNDPGYVSASGAAHGRQLCTPSLGADYDSSTDGKWSPNPCGTGGANSGSNQVCEGNKLRFRFVVANYSTSEVMVLSRVFFSTDTTLDDTVDLPSLSTAVTYIHPGGSKMITTSATVPDLSTVSGDLLKPILRASSWQDSDGDGVYEGGAYNDWAPLAGWLIAC